MAVDTRVIAGRKSGWGLGRRVLGVEVWATGTCAAISSGWLVVAVARGLTRMVWSTMGVASSVGSQRPQARDHGRRCEPVVVAEQRPEIGGDAQRCR